MVWEARLNGPHTGVLTQGVWGAGPRHHDSPGDPYHGLLGTHQSETPFTVQSEAATPHLATTPVLHHGRSDPQHGGRAGPS
jgi:hypothetical protein